MSNEMKGKPFTDLIGEVEGGRFLRELTEEIYNIMAAVVETRKPGALKLGLKFSPTGKGAVSVDAVWDSSIPEHDRVSTTFFILPDLTLVRDDPQQPKLPLRAVEDVGATAPPRVVEG